MSKRFTVPIGWFLGVAFLVLMLLLIRAAIGRPPRAPTARLPDGSRLRIVSTAYAATTNLTAPPHRLLGTWRTGLPYGFPVATTSGLPEFLVLLEREGWKRGNAARPARGAERLVMLDARDEVAS
ncbi:MAG: hypothetical protein J0L84_14495, partial [Verrucomicrobia bacterium]|nr:hypothetical protein [Verrucomicrobiota bacterium]